MSGTTEKSPIPQRRSHKRLPESKQAQSAVHFGLTVRSGSKYGLRIERDSYAEINKRSTLPFTQEMNPALWDAIAWQFEDDAHRIRTDEWCASHQAKALKNFDLNMTYFAALDRSEFHLSIADAIAARRGMVEVTDLNRWDGKPGIYIMVLDEFCQAYVGVTESVGGVKGRIRQHWSSNKAFDRLLFGSVEESILSIDSFRALDTTRIFAANVRDPRGLEFKVVESLPGKFLLNRMMGGKIDLLGAANALGVNVFKTHDLAEEIRSAPE